MVSMPAVADAAAGDAVAAVLLGCGRRDGKPVVAAHADHRAVLRRRHVERAVEIALAGGAFAKITGRYLWRLG